MIFMFDIICTPSASVNAMGCFIQVANAVLDSYDHDHFPLFYFSTFPLEWMLAWWHFV